MSLNWHPVEMLLSESASAITGTTLVVDCDGVYGDRKKLQLFLLEVVANVYLENIITIHGRPMLAWTIQSAIHSGEF